MGSVASKFRSVKKRVNAATKSEQYIRCLSKPILPHVCLLEAGQGKNVNGNMFALLRALQKDRYASFEAFFVVTKKTENEAAALFSAYAFKNVRLVLRDSAEYKELLARAKYLFTDNSFPTYFTKRAEQVYLNTWHGTPLKHLGLSDIENSLVSFANVQKNMLDADYVLFPNQLTQDAFFNDYKLGSIFQGTVLHADYPRNDALVDRDLARAVRERYDLMDKRLIAYMPTWRGTGRMASVREQTEQIVAHLLEIDQGLAPDELLCINLHFLLEDTIDYTQFERVIPFPKELETYDFLSACDALVTDYSSVFFDYGVTGRPIVLFAYDEERYMADKGTYLPLNSLPFPIAHTVPELLDALHGALAQPAPNEDYLMFQGQYCAYCTGHAATSVLDQVLFNDSELPHTSREPVTFDTMLYARDVQNDIRAARLSIDLEEAQAEGSVLLCIMGTKTARLASFLRDLPAETDVLLLPASRARTMREVVLMALTGRSKALGKALYTQLQSFYRRECGRLFHGIRARRFVVSGCDGSYAARMANELPMELLLLDRPAAYSSIKRRALGKRTLLNYRFIDTEDSFDECVRRISEAKGDAAASALTETYYSSAILCRLISRHDFETSGAFGLSGIARVRTMPGVDAAGLTFRLGEAPVQGEIRPLRGGSPTSYLARYSICVPKDLISQLPLHSGVRIAYEDAQGRSGSAAVKYNVIDRNAFNGRIRHIHLVSETATTAYFRQMAKNRLCFTVRDTTSIDSPRERRKIAFVHLVTRFVPPRDTILLYEKEGSRYEESASVVYEHLIDMGYRNAYFLLSDKSADWELVPEPYRENLVAKNTLRHYFLFFTAKTFVGTEMLAHAIDLRPPYKSVSDRLRDKSINYVFLQHGVMYMVSLDSESRTFFKPRASEGKFRVVTSSKREMEHFIDLGHYRPETLYLCGLPKYDRNTWDDDADTIAIMPTWRPWEYNSARVDFAQTGYYRMLCDMVASVPEDLRHHIKVLPHPLFAEAMGHVKTPLSALLETETSYDKVMRHTKLLITDYSSIAFDAFYRGANVIFFWRDKDSCMEQYGPKTHIMLDDETLFGDVAYRTEELAALVRPNYEGPQRDVHQEHYRRVVEFHDGCNTQRLMRLMKDDGII